MDEDVLSQEYLGLFKTISGAFMKNNTHLVMGTWKYCLAHPLLWSYYSLICGCWKCLTTIGIFSPKSLLPYGFYLFYYCDGSIHCWTKTKESSLPMLVDRYGNQINDYLKHNVSVATRLFAIWAQWKKPSPEQRVSTKSDVSEMPKWGWRTTTGFLQNE